MAVRIAVDVEGLDVAFDPGEGAWTLSGWGAVSRLREWTWGERRRLVEACTTAAGLDSPRFLDGLLRLLVDPPPPPSLRALYGYVCLGLLGAGDDADLQPLVERELLLARACGWSPHALDSDPAGGLDRLVRALRDSEPTDRRAAVPHPPVAGGASGWTSIVIVDGDDPPGGDGGGGAGRA